MSPGPTAALRCVARHFSTLAAQVQEARLGIPRGMAADMCTIAPPSRLGAWLERLETTVDDLANALNTLGGLLNQPGSATGAEATEAAMVDFRAAVERILILYREMNVHRVAEPLETGRILLREAVAYVLDQCSDFMQRYCDAVAEPHRTGKVSLCLQLDGAPEVTAFRHWAQSRVPSNDSPSVPGRLSHTQAHSCTDGDLLWSGALGFALGWWVFGGGEG